MKYQTLLTLLGVFVCTNVFTQTINRVQADIGGSQDDRSPKLCIGKDGGILIAGSSFSNKSLYKSQDSRGYSDYWVVKVNRNKTTGKIIKQWDRTIGGNSYDWLSAAIATGDGGYILGGTSRSGISGEKTDSSRGGDDYWIVKLNNEGNIEWDKTIGTGNYFESLTGLDVTNDGGYILSGHMGLTKLDHNGNVLWQKPLPPDHFYNSVQQLKEGGFIMADYYAGSSVRLTKADDDGNILWSSVFGPSSIIINHKAQQTKDKGFVLYGVLVEENDVSQYALKRSIYKTDSSGQEQWRRDEYDDYGYSFNAALEQTSDEGYLFGSSKWNYPWVYNYYFEKLDKNGNLLWKDSILTYNNQSYLSDLTEVFPNQYLVSGYSYEGVSGEKTTKNLGGLDYWIIGVTDTSKNNSAVKSVTSFSEMIKKGNQFAVYPNPAKDILHIQTNGKATFTLTDQSGKILVTKTITNKGEINIANLAAGLYYLKNNTTGETQKTLVVK